jgi:hypothetical protein
MRYGINKMGDVPFSIKEQKSTQIILSIWQMNRRAVPTA